MSVFYERALETLRQRPDVIAAGAAYSLPFGTNSTSTMTEDRRVAVDWFLPGYFEATRTRLVAGRLPTPADVRAGAKVSVVSQAAARTLFPGLDPIGRTITVDGADLSIIGVVGDVRRTLDAQQPYGRLPNAYILPTDRKAPMLLVARMRTRTHHVVEEMRADLSRLSPDEPVVAGWWSDSIDALMPFRAPRFQALILGTFATLAVALTALGIFAVVSFVVASRKREMGVRMALGASPRSLVGVVARHALVAVAAGILVGSVATRFLDSLVQAQLFGVQAGGMVTMLLAAAVVAVVAIGAAYLPARQASRVDPSEVLRAA
jgi:ABC-type antimicrobial peptide transport system permease subunit